MHLNIINSFEVCYYNFLVYFYLCLNSICPYYDDVIVSMHIHSVKLLLEKKELNMRKIKRMVLVSL